MSLGPPWQMRCLLLFSRRDRDVWCFAGPNGGNGVDYVLGVVPHQWPPVGKQDDYANAALSGVLLVSDVLIGGDQDFVALRRRQADEVSVGNSCPAFFVGGVDVMLV